MKRTILLAGSLTLISGPALAALKAGDHQITATAGGAKAVGAEQKLVDAGYLASLDYYYYPWNGYVGLGLDASFIKLEETGSSIAIDGMPLRVDINSRFASVAAVGRVNLTPQKSWTPYLFAGLGTAYNGGRANYHLSTPVGDRAWTTKDNYWRITGIVGAGVECNHDLWVFGLQGRFQTFRYSINSLSGGLRFGVKI